jgi:predicted ATPase/class 3 adenylate cyclase/regulation of enolase protein 1 (concanavalin A-like superfamily)
MKCPKCHTDNKEGRKFCSNCGSKLENVCPKCGFRNDPEDGFCGECGATLGKSDTDQANISIPKLEDMHSQLQSLIPDILAQKYLSAEQQATGENRPITALFADISGFTPLSATKSSEVIFQMVQDCFKQLVNIVAKYEGSISGFRGDGLLALFGAPILHENDAERAILAAIDMREAIKDHQLQVSIGINTAMMTVGEIQTQLHNEYTAYGTDINLAKRLQESAEPGQILVGAGSHRLTRKAFDFDVISDLTMKGLTQPVTAYSVKQVKVHPEKLRGIEGLRARMIGREHEFADAKEAVDEWLSRHGQIISVIGEAGIGKSRLVSEIKTYLSSKDGGSYFEGRCVSIGQPISYWPFLDILRTYFNLSEGDDTATIAGKVTDSITQLMPQSADETLPLLGQLLSIRFGNELDDRLKFATPEQIRHQTLMRLRDIFRTLAESQPLLLILEDLHWSDDLSLDLISLLMDELANTPLMLLCVYRPEKEHQVSHLSDQAQRKCLDRYTEITLRKLSTIESRQLVEELLTIDNLPENVKNMILDKSEGNPFFIEEVIRSLIDRDLVYRDEERWKARDEVSNIDVPDTIQSVILARVDRLQAEAKYVLQCASVIGRLFKYRLLEHLAQHERNLNTYLSEFEERDLVYPEHTIPELEYAFKHALTQEATYQGILERKRMEFHHQVAMSIEQLYHERLEEFYEELAYHYAKSTDNEKAVDYLIKAGDKSKAIYANQQAIGYYTRAMKLIEEFPEKNEQKFSILDGLGDVYSLIAKPDEALQSYESALEYSKDNKKRADIYRKIANVYGSQHQPDLVLKYIDIAIKELGEDIHSVEMARIYNIATWMYWSPPWSGHNYDKALEYGFKSLSIIEGTEHKRELADAYMIMGEIYTWIGEHDKAIQYAEKALVISQEMGDADFLGGAHYCIGFIQSQKGNLEIAVDHLEKSIELYKKAGNIQAVASGYHWLAGTYRKGKDYESVIRCCKAGIELDEERKFPVNTGHMFVLLSWAYRDKGEWDEAIKYAQEALHIGMTIGINDPWITSQAYKVFIEVYLAKGELDKALDYIKESADLSFDRSQAYKMLIEAYLAKGELDKARGYIKEIANLSFDLSNSGVVNDYLVGVEDLYEKTGKSSEFASFCQEIMEKNPEKVKGITLNQWYLEPKELSGQFIQTAFLDEFDGSALCPEWQWIDPKGNCCCELKGAWLKIQADSACNLWGWNNFDAPRLLQGISGDFAIETKIAPANEIMPMEGGLLVWKDVNNFIRFEKGMRGKNNMELSSGIDSKWEFFGRGMLVSDAVYLRIERMGNIFSAYCSSDGENWLTCGEVNFPAEDPIQVGIHAIGNIGAREGNMLDMVTAIRFGYFRLIRKSE